MTRSGHTAAAVILGAAVVYVSQAQPALLLVAGLLAGANAPDWSERVFRVSHRTWTHWPMWWAVLALAGLLSAPLWHVGAALAGFGAGGLLHLALDVGTPTGIPLHCPPDGRRRFSLYLYKTGDVLRESAALAGLAVLAGLLAVLARFIFLH